MAYEASHVHSSGARISGPAAAVGAFAAAEAKSRSDEMAWIQRLKEQGVKAAHPDDGWVDRHDNYVQFGYPQFNDEPQVGDLIALGREWKFRLVRVTKVGNFRTLLGGYEYRCYFDNPGGSA